MQKKAIIFIMISLLTYISVYAGNFTVAFIGLMPGGAPAFEQSFDRHLQERFTTTQEVNALDYSMIQKLRGKINLTNLSTISPLTLESLRRFCPDSTVFVWGTVDRYSVRNARAGLLHTQVMAAAAIRILIYNFSERNFAFSDTVACSVSKPTGWIFFHPASASSKVSAPDFADALELLEKEAVKKTFTMVNDIVKNEIMNPRRNQRVAGKKASPSISDMFNVPSVQAASVDGANGSDTTGVPYNQQDVPDTSSVGGNATGGSDLKK